MVWPVLLGIGAAAYAAKKLLVDSDSDFDDEEDEDDAESAIEQKRHKLKSNEASIAIRSFLETHGIPKEDKVSQRATPGRISKTLTGRAFLADCKVRYLKTPPLKKLDAAIKKKSAEIENIRGVKAALEELAATDKNRPQKRKSKQ